MSDECYFCGDDSDVLERHHVVPKRHGGSDKPENLVTVCPTCHRKLERLHGQRFYDQLGVGEGEASKGDTSREIIRALAEIQDIHQDHFPWYELGGEGDPLPPFAGVVREYLTRYDHGPVTWCKCCELATVYVQESENEEPFCARCGVSDEGADSTASVEAARWWLEEIVNG